MKSRKGILLTFLVLALCILAGTSALFPYPNDTIIASSMGHWDGAFDTIRNGMTVSQELTLTKQIRDLSLMITSFDVPMKQGQVDFTVTDSDGQVLAQESHTILPFRNTEGNEGADRTLTFQAPLAPGSYRLEVSFRNFDEAISAAPYRSEQGSLLGVCTLDGAEVDYTLYLLQGRASVIFPWLAAAVLAAVLVLTLILRDLRLFSACALAAVLCAAADAGLYLLTVYPTVFHYPAVLLNAVIIGWLCCRCLKAKGLWIPVKQLVSGEQLRFTALLAAEILVSLVLGCILCLLLGGFVLYKALFLASAVWAIVHHAVHWRRLIKDLPRSFLALSLAAGLCMSLLLPIYPNTWDEQTHYDYSIRLAGGPVFYSSTAAQSIVNMQIFHSDSRSENQEYYRELDAQSNRFSRFSNRSGWMPYSIGYLPHVAGTWLGQILGLPYHCSYILARVCNTIFYSLVIYFAMRRLLSGQILLYVIAMLPTNVFQAACYTYDVWGTGLMILGFSWFIGALQRREDPLSWTETAVMLGCAAVSCLPKAIYAVIIPIMLLMPRSKFTSDQHCRNYRVCVILATGIALSTYFLPFLMKGAFASVGDARGGDDVSGIGQFTFIMTHPVQYTGILLRFLAGFVNPLNSFNYTTSMAYLPSVDLHLPAIVLVAAAALLDRDGRDRSYSNWYTKALTAFLLFGCCCLVATALYISFTSVGKNVIEGCQPRYLLPLIFPGYALIFNLRKTDKALPGAAGISFAAASGVLIYIVMWLTFACRFAV